MPAADILTFVFIIVLVILAVMLVLVGIQLFFTLNELKLTLRRVNYYLDSLEEKIDTITYPFRIISSFMSGFGSGSRAADSFASFLKKPNNKC